MDPFTASGSWFQPFTTLIEQKFFLMSRFVLFISRLNIDELNHVLTVEAVFNLVNQVFSQTSSCWCNIFQVCIMSPLLLLSSREGKPNSFSLSWFLASVLLSFSQLFSGHPQGGEYPSGSRVTMLGQHILD